MLAIGGTFETLHIGHQYLLSEAASISDVIIVGITSTKFAKLNKLYIVSDFHKRRKRVINFLNRYPDKKVEVSCLEDPYGPSTTSSDIKVLVVTPDTYKNAKRINEIRKTLGLKPLILYVAGYLRNSWGYPINSTYIKLGYMDEWGRIT